jgi:hypothetical protein
MNFYLHRIFNSHNCHEANLHASSVLYHQQCFAVNVKVGIVHDLLIGTCYTYSSVHRFTGCSGGRATRMLEEIPMALERNIVPARWICGSLCQSDPRTSHCHLTTIAEFVRAGQWLGLPGYRTSHQWISSCGATLKP